MKRTIAVIVALGVLSGCSEGGSFSLSSLNPFARPQATEETLVAVDAIEDDRGFVQTITELRAEPTRSGIILRARGANSVQGYHDIELVETNRGFVDENGVLTFEFRAYEPRLPQPAPTARSREVIAAVFISSIKLQNVTALRVIAAQNQITIRN